MESKYSSLRVDDGVVGYDYDSLFRVAVGFGTPSQNMTAVITGTVLNVDSFASLSFTHV
jgi:hypothetical protein